MTNRPRSKLYTCHVLDRSPLWESHKRVALARAGHRCESCTGAGVLDLAHLSYDGMPYEDMAQLAILCRCCHRRHDRTDDWSHWTVRQLVHLRRILHQLGIDPRRIDEKTTAVASREIASTDRVLARR
jgi:hypothetical protein